MAIAEKINQKIKGDFVKQNNITELTILSEFKQNNFGKLEGMAMCNDKTQTKGTWQLNAQSNNALIDAFGKDTLNWLKQKVAIGTKEYDSGTGIIVTGVN